MKNSPPGGGEFLLGFRRVPFANAKSCSNTVTRPGIGDNCILLGSIIIRQIYGCMIIECIVVLGGIGKITYYTIFCCFAEFICRILLGIRKVNT